VDLDLDGTKYIRKYHWFKADEVRLSGVNREYDDEMCCYEVIC
jgi:hypothetical protein